MPRLPSPDQLRQERFQPAQGIVDIDVSAPARALGAMGSDIQAGLETYNRHLNETAELHAQDALVQLKRKQNELAIGDTGYAQLRNGAATEQGVLPRYQDLHKQAVTGLSQALSPLAKEKFGRMAEKASVGFQSGVLTHIMREDLSHRGEVYKAQVAVSGETMGLNHANPVAISRGRSEIDATVAEYISKNGVTDPALRERMLQDARGVGHKQVIDGYIQADNAKGAEEYFKTIEQELTPEERKGVHNMLKPQVAHEMGKDIAGELFLMHLDGKSESQIFEKKLKLTTGKGADVTRAADQMYSAQVKAREADRVNESGDILLSFYKGEGGSGVGDPRLREIDAADPTFGVQIREKMDAIEKRRLAAAKAAQAGEPDAPSNMALYAELTESIRNGQESPQSIAQYAGTFKDTEIKSLLGLHAASNSAAGRHKINTALINAGMPKSADDAERKAAYKGYVEQRLQEWKDNNPGKTPTPAEERGIIASASAEHIEVGRLWNSKVEAYRADGRKTYPKRMETMLPGASEDQLVSAYSYLQNIRSRLTKDDPPISDAEIIKLWQERHNR